MCMPNGDVRVLLAMTMAAASAAPVSRASGQAMGVVSGVVQSVDARAIPGASVTIKTFVGDKLDSVTALTNARGLFELRVAGLTSATLEVGAPRMSWAWQRIVTPVRDTLRFRVVLSSTSGRSRAILADTLSESARLIAAFQLSDSVFSLAHRPGRLPDAATTRAAMQRVVPRLVGAWNELHERSWRVRLAHEILVRGADAVDSAQASRFAREFDVREHVWDDVQYSASLFAIVARTSYPHAPADSVRRTPAFRVMFNRAVDSALTIPGVRASVREDLLWSGAVAAAKIDRDTTRARRMLAVLERDFPGSDRLALARESIDEHRKVRVGQLLPSFSVHAMNDTVRRSLDIAKSGHRFTLVDFWATWCTPCVVEIPTIARALERWRSAGLAVVSVSFDGSASRVSRFRRARHAMRWEHWMAVGLFPGETSLELEISGLPRTVLVDSSGRVVAEDAELSGERITGTLSRLLGTPAARR